MEVTRKSSEQSSGILTDEDELRAFDKAVLTELRELYLSRPLDERLQVKQAFNDISDEKLRWDICGLIEMVEEVACRNCGNASECDCPPYDPRVELYDDPARGTR